MFPIYFETIVFSPWVTYDLCDKTSLIIFRLTMRGDALFQSHWKKISRETSVLLAIVDVWNEAGKNPAEYECGAREGEC